MENKKQSSLSSKKDKIDELLPTFLGGIIKGPKYNELSKFNRIVICGSSLSGKSTIASIFRCHKRDGKTFDTVHRYTTRPSRKGKNQSSENSNVEDDFFHDLKNEEHIIYRQRGMERYGDNQRKVMYGFHSD